MLEEFFASKASRARAEELRSVRGFQPLKFSRINR